MDLKTYQENALRTESKIDEVHVNEDILICALQLHKMTGEILDGIKRSIYYQKNDRITNIYELINNLQNTAQYMSRFDWEDKTIMDINPRLLHGGIGICTESGEIAEAFENHLVGNQPIDAVNIEEEMHDISWYEAILNDELGLVWEDGLEKNINKLKVRFPDKYSDENASDRNLDEERKALEGK